MMVGKYILSIDQGTTSSRAVLFDSLRGADLQTALVNHKKRGMTDDWRTRLQRAYDQKKISSAVQAAFAQG